jgi:hypothetical protein
MSKKRGTKESAIKPGAAGNNLSLALYGDQADRRFISMREMVLSWLNDKAAENLAEKYPEEFQALRARQEKKLKADTVDFVKKAIVENRPEDLRKLAEVMERIHETGGITFDGISPDILSVHVHCLTNPRATFTKKEITKIVADAQKIPELNRRCNEDLRKRTEAIIKMLGVPMAKGGK